MYVRNFVGSSDYLSRTCFSFFFFPCLGSRPDVNHAARSTDRAANDGDLQPAAVVAAGGGGAHAGAGAAAAVAGRYRRRRAGHRRHAADGHRPGQACQSRRLCSTGTTN